MKGSRKDLEEWSAAQAREQEAAAAAEAAEGRDETEGIEPEYRRRRQPVRVRRSRMGDWARAARKHWKLLLISAVGLAAAASLYGLLFRSAWFVLAGSDQITVSGAQQTPTASVIGVFSSDLGRNVFFIPLEARRQAIEAVPWVRSAEVLRLWPARLQVRIHERVPVAFARLGEQLQMVDAGGVLLDRPHGGNFDFPVLTGLAGVGADAPNAPGWLAQRQAQMRLYLAMRADLDRDGGHHSQDFSEIDLSDPSDVRARVSEADGTSTLIQFGNRNFGARYGLYLSQIGGWRQKYPGLVSVDLQYDGQAIVDPGTAPVKPAGPAPAKPAGPRRPR